MNAPGLSRRKLMALFATATLANTLQRARGGPLDQGIGGTGAAPPNEESDRGIGGTGVIGTIRRFGSIVVNDLRITYPTNVLVRIDGQPASIRDLKIGQVVRVSASGPADALSTRTIDVASEVVGPVQRSAGRRLTVLGQSVLLTGTGRGRHAVGEVVAVSGLRRNDGVVVASFIQPRPGAPSRVAGPVDVSDTGALRIGNLALVGVDPELIGRRVLVEGSLDGNRLKVTRAVAESTLLPDVRNLSIEAFVEHRGDALVLGSGLRVATATGLTLPAGRSVRAVIAATVGVDGQLDVRSIRANEQGSLPGGDAAGPQSRGSRSKLGSPGSGGPGGDRPIGGPAGSGPAGSGSGHIPMNFDMGGPGAAGTPPGPGMGGGASTGFGSTPSSPFGSAPLGTPGGGPGGPGGFGGNGPGAGGIGGGGFSGGRR